MSQELFVSVNQLIEMSEAKNTRYDHVVIESSGISEPKSVRSVFQDAEAYGVQLLNKVWEPVRVSLARAVPLVCLCVGASLLVPFYFVSISVLLALRVSCDVM